MVVIRQITKNDNVELVENDNWKVRSPEPRIQDHGSLVLNLEKKISKYIIFLYRYRKNVFVTKILKLKKRSTIK